MVQYCDWINPASGRVIPDGGDEDDDVAEVKVANDTIKSVGGNHFVRVIVTAELER